MREQQVEAFHHEDRQRGGEPGARAVGLRAGLDLLPQPPVHRQRLADDRDPGGGDRGEHRGRGIGRQLQPVSRAHRADQQQRADDVRRHQREIDPVVGARHAVLQAAEREQRQAGAGDVERHDLVGVEVRAEQPHAERRGHRPGGRHRDHEPAAAGEEAAQHVELLLAGVFGDEALRPGRDAEIDQAAEQQHPGPHIDVDAELERSHPAREQHLAHVKQHSARDADQERGGGAALRARGIRMVVEPGTHGARKACREEAAAFRAFGAGKSHALPRASLGNDT